MGLILKTNTLTDVVDLQEMKLFLRIDHDAEDLLVKSLVTAAKIYIETSLGMALLEQSWGLYLHEFPRSKQICLPLGPFISLEHVGLLDEDDQLELIDADLYETDAFAAPAQLYLKGGRLPAPKRDLNGIEIIYKVGFGQAPGDIPAPLIQALRMIVAHWYERREPVSFGDRPAEIPHTAAAILANYRTVRI